MSYWCDDEGLRREQQRLDDMQARALRRMREREGGLPPVTPRNEARSFVHAFFRGLGYCCARLVMGALRGR